jgi:hypothetical protein
MGRPSLYSEELAESICQLVSIGYTLKQIETIDDMPAERTILTWAATNPEFQQQYARARDASADAFADRVANVAWMAEEGQTDPQAAKVAMDGYKWVAARRNPKKYGERMQVSGPDEKPIETAPVISASDAVVAAVAEALKRTGG